MGNAYKSAAAPIQFSGSNTYTLTASYVTSDDMIVDFAKRVTIYPEYAAGLAEAGNSLDFAVFVNPLDAESDPSDLYWAQLGNYNNAAGTMTELPSKVLVTEGSPAVFKSGVPVDFQNMNCSRLRIKAKENGVALNFGQMRMFVVKSDIS